MVVGIIGENCAGKSTLAQQLAAAIGAKVVTGKDYLRMAKSESAAVLLFKRELLAAADGDSMIYVISEPEQVRLLPEGAIRILVTADLGVIKERFKARMHGSLPAPVAAMLERKHGMFDDGCYDYRFDGVNGSAAALCEAIQSRIKD